MSSQYRFVHFSPNPAFAEGPPVAALVRSHSAVSVAIAPRLPDAGCLGGPRMLASLRLAIEDLARATSFERLPQSLGPHLSLGAPHVLPVGITEPVEWVRSVALRLAAGQGMAVYENTLTDDQSPSGRPHRATAGFSFFVANKVDSYVRKIYSPKESAPFLPEEASLAMGNISHWVSGQSRLLLLEPLMLQRPHPDKDIQEIARRFAAYSKVRSEQWSPNVPKPRLIAYVLSGGRADERARACGILEKWSDEVVDVAVRQQKRHFVEQIEAVGAELLA